ncbi:pseudouridine synthase [Suillus lakei]|nr:pseudouridine synthase [Suillus lakei]
MSPSSPLDWARNLLKRRRRSGEDIELQGPSPTVVEVPSTHPPTCIKPFHFSSHPKRKIAIKLCDLGWEYNRLADMLFKAFVKAQLVDETGSLDGCGWEKCGRTNRGVSAAGQVVPLWSSVLAWSPISPDFSARFNCKHRHYKYFFTSHGLDISLMQSAANRLIGEHDFRNLCKLDPGKQITNFHRSFLYHQVRHIMAVLFLVGTGLEQPSIISALMNVSPETSNTSPESELPLVCRKPEYQMADALPLTLWDCECANSESIHQRSLIHTTLDEHFITAAPQYHSPPPQYFPFSLRGPTYHRWLPGFEDPMIVRVKPGPSTCNASSTEKTSTSYKLLDFLRYAINSFKIPDSENNEVLQNTALAPISDTT